MKSTQDLCIWLNKVEQALEITSSSNLLSIEIFSDKSFRVNQHIPEKDVETLYDSEELYEQSNQGIDINDLIYHDPENFAEQIKEILEGKKDVL